MTVENISWSISTKECCRPRRRLNPRPPGLQSDGASNWATEAGLCWGLRPSQPNGVMSSAVSLPNHTLTGQALSSKRLTSIVHIPSPETDNCPSWISGRERMTVENISWSISTKECCRPRRGLNPRPPGLQSDGASNSATEAGSLLIQTNLIFSEKYFANHNYIFGKGLFRWKGILGSYLIPRAQLFKA